MKKIVLTITAGMLFVWQGLSFADSSVDALIQKLEDKGILTSQEADQVKQEVSTSEQSSQQATFKSMLPDWINSLTISGDFRLRDQYQRLEQAKGNSNTNRQGYNRVRIRARLNFTDQLNDKVKVVFGIATNGENSAGVGNPRSNNFTLGGNNFPSESAFNKPEAVINKAYAVYTPTSWLTLEGGMMDNPIWEPLGGNSQLLWDPNINPEGGAIMLQKKINDYITLWSNNDIFILGDANGATGGSSLTNSTAGFETDPFMYVYQEGIKGNLTEKLYYKGAVTYYGVNNPNRTTFGNRPSSSSSNTDNTNSTSPNGDQYTYGFYVIGGEAEVGLNDPFGELLPSPIYIPQIGVTGGYFQNQGAPSGDNAAWDIGGYAGSSQLNGWGTWKLTSVYKVLERDSWLDILPDQDDYNGATDTAGYRTEIDIGLAKNIWFTATWYHVNVYKDIASLGYLTGTNTAFSASAPYNMYQADINFKF